MRIIRERLLELLAEVVGRNVTQLQAEMKPLEELEMDSVKLLDFVIEVEDQFGIDFQDFSELSQYMSSVGMMLDFLCKKVEERGGDG